MVNKEKKKGTDWERTIAKKLNEFFNTDVWKRIPGSGALGTILGLDSLIGDVSGKFNFCNMKFIIEAKTGYGGSKQLTLKKEWLDKVKDEASRVYGMGAVVGKFLGAKTGAKNFIVMDLEDFMLLMEVAEKTYEEYQKLCEEIYE
jgi:Holliday junction resolvase